MFVNAAALESERNFRLGYIPIPAFCETEMVAMNYLEMKDELFFVHSTSSIMLDINSSNTALENAP